jgi:hypothetical protein
MSLLFIFQSAGDERQLTKSLAVLTAFCDSTALRCGYGGGRLRFKGIKKPACGPVVLALSL